MLVGQEGRKEGRERIWKLLLRVWVFGFRVVECRALNPEPGSRA